MRLAGIEHKVRRRTADQRPNAPSIPQTGRPASPASGSPRGSLERVSVVIAAITSLATLITVIVSHQQAAVVERGQVADRFSRATEQLGSNATDVRLGAIYSFDKLLRDAPDDQPRIVNMLATYVREHSRHPKRSTQPPATPPSEDIQAALNVLGHRDTRHDRDQVVDLHGADLHGADLHDTNLVNADIRDADLRSAKFRSAKLSGADLHNDNISGADLRATDLTGADIRGAYLGGVDIRGADLRNIHHSGVHLAGLKAGGAPECAVTDEATRLPPTVEQPPSC